MKKFNVSSRLISVVLTLFVVTSLVFAITSIKKEEKKLSLLWAKLKIEEADNKPQSVQFTAKKIIELAQKQGNVIDAAIAWRKRLEATGSIDIDDNTLLIEQLNRQPRHPFYQLILADQYLVCWNRWGATREREETSLDSINPDIKSWSKKQYADAVRQNTTSNQPVAGDSTEMSGTNHQFLFPNKDWVLRTLPTAQQMADYLAILLYKRAFDCNLFDIPETLDVNNLFVNGNDFLQTDYSNQNTDIAIFLNHWQHLLSSVTTNERLYIKLDLLRLEQMRSLCASQVAVTNIHQYKLYNTLLLQQIKKYKEKEAAIDLLEEAFKHPDFVKHNSTELIEQLRYTIAKFPKTKGVDELIKQMQSIDMPSITVGTKINWQEGLEDSITIKGKNINEVTLSIYHSPFPKIVNRINEIQITDYDKTIRDFGTLLNTQTIKMIAPQPHQEAIHKLPFTFNKPGVYYIKVQDAQKRKKGITKDKLENHFTFNVNRYLYYIHYSSKSNELNILRATGESISSKRLDIEQYEVDRSIAINPKVLHTDTYGAVNFNNEARESAFRVIEEGEPVTSLIKSWIYRPKDPQKKTAYDQHTIHTDRAIYRPGQNVQFKGVIFRTDTKEFVLCSDKSVRFEAFDPSGKSIYHTELNTTDMGSFAGQFTLPETIMGGNCSLHIDNHPIAVMRVEEYKKPTLELKINPIQQTYTFGDTIEISGYVKNYAGISTSNIEIRLSLGILKNMYQLHLKYPKLPASSIITHTDSEGRFAWKYYLPTSYSINFPNKHTITNAAIKAVCTDEKGESKEAFSELKIGYTPLSITTQLPALIDLGEPTHYTPTVLNTSGFAHQTQIYTQWKHLASKTLFEHTLEANKEVNFAFAKKYPKGRYWVKTWIVDAIGRKAEYENEVTLFDTKTNELPEKLDFYARQINDKNEFASFLVASTLPEQNITIDIHSPLGRVERIRMKLSKEIKKISLPYKKSYGDKTDIDIIAVNNGTVVIKRFNITAPAQPKKVSLQWITLRNHLTPNTQEEWKIRWIDSLNHKSNAEICVTMYDASLNQYEELSLPNTLKHHSPESSFTFYTTLNYINYESFAEYHNTEYPTTWEAKENVFHNGKIEELIVSAFGSGKKKVTLMGSTKGFQMERKMSPAFDSNSIANRQFAPTNDALNPISLRSELVETAFFEPLLRPDSSGYCTIKFRAPQALTQWSVKAWGYNRQGDVATLDTTVITRKILAVQPNVPRFFREGDSPVLMANVANLSDDSLQIAVRMILYTHQGDTLLNTIQHLSLPSKATKAVAAQWDVLSNSSQIIYEVWATSDKHIDGERHLIPLLRRDITVNSGTPLFLKGGSTELLPLPNELTKALQKGRFNEAKIEIIQNPIYFAIKSLPFILDLSSNNVLAVTHSLFARMMAQQIMNQNPEIISLIETWQQSSDGKTLMEQNKSFKLSPVQETPFFTAVNREQEAMKQWSHWVKQPSQLEIANRAAFEILKTMQQTDGGFTWFNGGKSSYFISLRIAKLLTTLAQHGANYAEGEHAIRVQLIRYLDNELLRQIESSKAKDRNTAYWKSTTYNHIEYLALRADYRDIPFPGKLLSYHKLMMKHIGKIWKTSPLHTQSLLIKVAHKYGLNKEAKAISTSLLQHTKIDQLGRYFPNNKAQVWSNTEQLATHIAAIDALMLLDTYPNEVKELTHWLYAQYQTQRIFQPSIAAQSIDLILRNLPTINPENAFVVTLDGQTLEPTENDRKSPVLTYLLSEDNLRNATQGFEIKHAGEATAWGGLLYQYQSPIDDVQDKTGNLSVQKDYYRQAADRLIAIESNSPLKIGEKLVMRYTIRATRDFDYVQIQDLKGAFVEPTQTISQYRASGGLWYYLEPKDRVTNLFFYFIPKGTYTIDYPVWVNASGDYSIGTATIQSALSPEFVSFSGAKRMKIEKK